MNLRSYACWVSGYPQHQRIINAENAGKARYLYLLAVGDAYTDLSFKDIKVRSLGACRETESIVRTNSYTQKFYGKQFRVGQKVTMDFKRFGIVVDGDAQYFVVLFDDGSRGRIHPNEIVAVG